MANDAGEEEISQLQYFSGLYIRLLDKAVQAFSELDSHEQFRFKEIIAGDIPREGHRKPAERDMIANGESAAYSLREAVPLLFRDFAKGKLDNNLFYDYVYALDETYEMYRSDIREMHACIRKQLPNKRLPETIGKAVQAIVNESIRERVKESVSPSFPVHPSFETHLPAPTEHLAIAYLLKDNALLMEAQQNLTAAYVIDMGYPCEIAEAEMRKQDMHISKMIQEPRIDLEGERPQSLQEDFSQWLKASQAKQRKQR